MNQLTKPNYKSHTHILNRQFSPLDGFSWTLLTEQKQLKPDSSIHVKDVPFTIFQFIQPKYSKAKPLTVNQKMVWRA